MQMQRIYRFSFGIGVSQGCVERFVEGDCGRLGSFGGGVKLFNAQTEYIHLV